MVSKVTDLKFSWFGVVGFFFKSIQCCSEIIFRSILPVSTPVLQPTKLAGSKADIVDFPCTYCSCITIPSPDGSKNLKPAPSVVY